MRPRVFPAEDLFGRVVHAEVADASMRPRVFPAEDACRAVRTQRTARASMRPRVFPAEDDWRKDNQIFRWRGFNEAAGIPRGRHPPNRLMWRARAGSLQ